MVPLPTLNFTLAFRCQGKFAHFTMMHISKANYRILARTSPRSTSTCLDNIRIPAVMDNTSLAQRPRMDNVHLPTHTGIFKHVQTSTDL